MFLAATLRKMSFDVNSFVTSTKEVIVFLKTLGNNSGW